MSSRDICNNCKSKDIEVLHKSNFFERMERIQCRICKRTWERHIEEKAKGNKEGVMIENVRNK